MASAQNIKKEQIITEQRLFIGPNADFYIGKWKESLTYSWNWSTFFGGVFWFAYRKMYLFTIMLAFYILLANSISPLFGLMVNVGTAVYANYVYYFFAKSKVKRIKASIQDQEEKNITIAKAGGTSWGDKLGGQAGGLLLL